MFSVQNLCMWACIWFSHRCPTNCKQSDSFCFDLMVVSFEKSFFLYCACLSWRNRIQTQNSKCHKAMGMIAIVLGGSPRCKFSTAISATFHPKVCTLLSESFFLCPMGCALPSVCGLLYCTSTVLYGNSKGASIEVASKKKILGQGPELHPSNTHVFFNSGHLAPHSE